MVAGFFRDVDPWAAAPAGFRLGARSLSRSSGWRNAAPAGSRPFDRGGAGISAARPYITIVDRAKSKVGCLFSMGGLMARRLVGALMAGALAASGLVLAASASRTTLPVRALGGEFHPVDHLTIERESWSRGNGLLIATVTFGNANRFALAPVIIACDILKQGAPQGTRGTLIPRIIPPGRTTVEGIEFTMLERGLEGGRCKVLSAERLWAVEPGLIRLPGGLRPRSGALWDARS
jgi:hypothetical protein